MYQIINLLLQPYFLLIFVLGLLVFSLWRRGEVGRRRKRLFAVSIAVLYLGSTPAVTYFLLGSLEWDYPPTTERPENVDAIVILSAGIYPPDAIRPTAVLGERSVTRCIRGAELFEAGEPIPVVLSGGKVDPNRLGPTLADAMADLFRERFGIDDKHLLIESNSRTTYENAVESCRLLKEKGLNRIALVTDATHLHRSTLCFRKQGIEVVPVGCGYRATDFRWELDAFLPNPQDAAYNQAAFHEYLGLLWYWLKGRI